MAKVQTLSKNGFVIVASRTISYLHAAQLLCDSLNEYAPNHSVVLFTEERWKNNPGNHIFNKVIVNEITDSNRAKLTALHQTPFEITCYLDADMCCMSSRASEVFDLLDDGYDMAWTRIRPYNAAKLWWDTRTTSHPHGGMCVYRKSDAMMDFMKLWWERWKDLQERGWDHYSKLHNWTAIHWFNKAACMGWDQFPLGLMLGITTKEDPWYYPGIKWHYIEKKDCIWNWIQGYNYLREGILEEDVVFRDYSSLLFKEHYWNQMR
jgi:hypothetical protein